MLCCLLCFWCNETAVEGSGRENIRLTTDKIAFLNQSRFITSADFRDIIRTHTLRSQSIELLFFIFLNCIFLSGSQEYIVQENISIKYVFNVRQKRSVTDTGRVTIYLLSFYDKITLYDIHCKYLIYII